MAHLYRGEMQRMTVWRERIDTTFHWAIILTTGITTFTIGQTSAPHYVMLLALAFVGIFMLVEGRRYQHLHHSKWRLNLLEHNYFADQLGSPRPMEAKWRAQLSADLRKPHFTISRSLGVRLRLRRNYLMLTYVVSGVWFTKLFIHPQPPTDLMDLYQRMAVGDFIPSWFVAVTASLLIVGSTIVAFLTPSEEASEHWSRLEHERFVHLVNPSGKLPDSIAPGPPPDPPYSD